MYKTINCLLLLSALFFWGCEQNRVDVSRHSEEGLSATIRLRIGKGPTASAQTRADSEECKLEKAYLFVYDKDGNLYNKKIVTIDPTVTDAYTIDMGIRSGNGYSIYVIANSGYLVSNSDDENSVFGYKNVKTETLLKEMVYSGRMADSHPMTMVGVKNNVEIGTGMNSLDIPLYRIVSKVTLHLTAKVGSDIQIKSYQVFSLPDKTYMIPRAMDTENEVEDVTGGDDAGSVDEPNDWSSGTLKAVDATTLTASFYMFENRRGVNENIHSQKDKNATNAPERATYVLITGETATKTIMWRFYLGGNPTTNFNVKRNCDYVYNVTLSETDTDSRVDMFPTLVGGNSNCYMVKPGGTVSIPVERANESPLEIVSSTYNPVSGTYYQLMTSTPWKVELIWESSPGLIAFTDADKTGNGPLHSFSVTAAHPANSGNAVVGIRNSETNDILWSWHIWVTDYDGTERFEHNNGKRDWTFMDRALGATSNVDGDLHAAGLLYQWGRKDPFPGVGQEGGSWKFKTADTDPVRVYNASGVPFEIEKMPVPDVKPNNFTNAIRHPTTLYYNRDVSYDWFSKEDLSNKSTDLWNGGEYDATSFTMSKSIYDPCPAGWRVPFVLDIKSPIDGLHIIMDGFPEKHPEPCLWVGAVSPSAHGVIWRGNYWPTVATRMSKGYDECTGGFEIGAVNFDYENYARYWLASILRDYKDRYSHFFFYSTFNPKASPNTHTCRDNALMVRCVLDKEYL